MMFALSAVLACRDTNTQLSLKIGSYVREDQNICKEGCQHDIY